MHCICIMIFIRNDIKNTIAYNEWYGAKIFKVSATNGYTMYFIKASYLSGTNTPYEHYILIGRRPDGKWVKYFNTEDLCKQYMGKSENVSIQKITANGNTITANYARCNNLGRNEGTFYAPKADEFGEFRFKWDEAAKWFSVEKVDSQNKPAPQKPTQENKPVTNQPMQFSQPVKVGSVSDSGIVGGGYNFEGAVSNTGTKKNNEYYNGIVAFGKGDDLIYLHYNNKNFNAKDLKRHYGGKNFNNTFLFTQAYCCDFTQIKTNKGVTLYMIYETQFDVRGNKYTLLGRKSDGTFVKYFDTWDISEQYFGKGRKMPTDAFYDNWYCKSDTIVIEYEKFTRPGKIKVGEFRFKWDEKAQWFSVEHVKY